MFLSSQIGVRDAVSRPLLVEPSGRMETYTKSEFICLKGYSLTLRYIKKTEDSEVVNIEHCMLVTFNILYQQ